MRDTLAFTPYLETNLNLESKLFLQTTFLLDQNWSKNTKLNSITGYFGRIFANKQIHLSNNEGLDLENAFAIAYGNIQPSLASCTLTRLACSHESMIQFLNEIQVSSFKPLVSLTLSLLWSHRSVVKLSRFNSDCYCQDQKFPSQDNPASSRGR